MRFFFENARFRLLRWRGDEWREEEKGGEGGGQGEPGGGDEG